MPRGDRTGPLGRGPASGRGMGNCSGYANPGYLSNIPGRCFGWARGMRSFGGRGRSMGWFNQPYDGVNANDTVAGLEERARYLKEELTDIRRTISAAKTGNNVDNV